MRATLQAGSRISHYRVISSLGAGGMGEVYTARDESLERAVALKILPPDLVKNEERVRRFVQEAKSASSLNHPHIVTIYEIGQAPVVAETGGAAPEASIHFIAMELITGETLKHKIHHEKADLRTLLGYLAQAAEGLAKAHGAGIVHRDLKPENIMISRDGYTKVLDFGLAKLTEREEYPQDLTTAPTATHEPTREGAVLGTIGYMSPEQVQGKAVDHRSDVFSFGSILYEAATRRKPFTADSDVETMHRILHDRPAEVEELNPEAPAVLRRVIRRCLAKNPDQRFQSMKDLALELHEIEDEFETLSASSDSERASAATGALPVTRRRSPWPWVAAGVAVVLVAVVGALLVQRLGVGRGPAAPFQTMRMTRLTTSGDVVRATLSPDGKYVAHVIREEGRHGLWVKQVVTGSDVRITPPIETPFRGVSFSLDGNYVFYVNQETSGPGYSNLYQVPVLGGATRKLLFDVDTAPSFSPDGKQLAFVRGYPEENESALMVANADGTAERKLAVLPDPISFTFSAPAWSPDGKRIAAIVSGVEGGVHKRVVTVDVADGSALPVGDRRWFNIGDVAWLPDGRGFVMTASERVGTAASQVWWMAYPDGDAVRITNDLNNYGGVSVTQDGTSLATGQFTRISNLWVVRAGDAGAAEQLTFGTGSEDAVSDVAALPQGGVVYSAPGGEGIHIWWLAESGARPKPLTSGKSFNVGAEVDREGNAIVFTSVREDGVPHVWRMDLDGGNATQITNGGGETVLTLTSDGKWIVYRSFRRTELWIVPVSGGSPAKLIDDALTGADISPDGTRIAYDTFVDRDGRFERMLRVAPADGGPAIWSRPWPDGFGLRWARSGDALTFVREDDGVGNVWSQPLDGGPARQVTDFTSGRTFSFDWSPDGERLYLARGEVRGDVVLIKSFR